MISTYFSIFSIFTILMTVIVIHRCNSILHDVKDKFSNENIRNQAVFQRFMFSSRR